MPIAWGVRHLLDDSAEALTALVAWGDHRLLVGTASGALLLFSGSSAGIPTLLERRRLHQAAVTHLAAAEACDTLVLLLSDGTVPLHSLSSLEPRPPLPLPSPCLLLSLSPAETPTLAAAAKLSLRLFAWQGEAFALLRELPLAEPARCLAWGGEAQLWLALRHRFVRLRTSGSHELEELLPAAKGAPPVGMPLLPADPTMPAEVVLLSQDTLGVVLGVDAKPSRGLSISFSEPPLALAHSEPYVLAVGSRGVEVHFLLRARASIHHIDLPHATALATAGHHVKGVPPRCAPVFVLTPSSVVMLQPLALPAHACALAAASDGEEAVLLTERCILPALRLAGEHEVALLHLARLSQQLASLPSAAPPPPSAAPPSSAALSPGSRLLVAYLTSLPPHHRPLLLRFAQWLLSRDAAAFAALSLTSTAAAWVVAPRDVAAAVRQHSPADVAAALRRMAAASSGKLRAEAVAALVDECIAAAAEGGAREELLRLLDEEPLDAAEAERRLAQLRQAHVDARLVAPHQAALLRRLGRHEEAIGLLAGQLRDARQAEEYCALVLAAPQHDAASARALYSRLVAAYMAPAEGKPMVRELHDLLLAQRAHLDPIQVFHALPPGRPLAEFHPVLQLLLRDSQERRQQSQVVLSLGKSVSLQTNARLLEDRSARFVVRADSECSSCRKRIGTAAFARLSSGELAHVHCHD